MLTVQKVFIYNSKLYHLYIYIYIYIKEGYENIRTFLYIQGYECMCKNRLC